MVQEKVEQKEEPKEEPEKVEEEIKKEKKYIQPPVIAHESPLPSMAFEEVNNGKLVPSQHDFHFDEEEKPEEVKEKQEEDDEQEKPKLKGKTVIKKIKEEKPKEEKKYIQPPVIAHESEPPSLTFEESNNVRLIPAQHDLNIEEETKPSEEPKEDVLEEDKKEKTEKVEEIIQKEEIKEKTKEKEYKQPPVVAHPSELPSIAFEEIGTGKLVASAHDFHFVEEEKPEEEKKIEKKPKEVKEIKEVKEEEQPAEQKEEIKLAEEHKEEIKPSEDTKEVIKSDKKKKKKKGKAYDNLVKNVAKGLTYYKKTKDIQEPEKVEEKT